MKFGWGSDHKKCLENLDLGIRKPYLKCRMCHGQDHHAYVCLGLVGLQKQLGYVNKRLTRFVWFDTSKLLMF